MASFSHISFRQHDVKPVQGPTTTRIRGSTPVKSILKRNEAKSVIETTLMKTAGIISSFTENNISQSQNNVYFNKILAPERFGFSSNIANIIQKNPSTPQNVKTNTGSEVPYNNAPGRKKPDLIAKLPSAIVDILKEDSNSSIPSMQKAKKYHYHSKKMSLKQREDSKYKEHALLTTSTENIAPKIVVVSAPLQLENNSVTTDTTQTEKIVFEESAKKTKLPRLAMASLNSCFGKDSATCNKISYNTHHFASAIKSEKRVGTTVRKSEKLNIGVENGMAFVLGSKTRSPYFNTFGHPILYSKGNNDSPSSSNRKWVVNVGNFLDDEISLVLTANHLTITGSRLPSLNFPELQTVSETIDLPPELDINNLRIYRAQDALSFLVIQEKQQ